MAKEKQRGFFRRKPNKKETITEANVTQDINNNQRVSDKIIKSVSTSSVTTESSVSALTANERQLMELYDTMDCDAVISASLDLFADNTTLINSKTGHVAAVQSENISFQSEINDFLWNVFNVDSEAWHIIRSLAKDGKVILDTQASCDGKEWSFNKVDTPYNVHALTYNNYDIKYYAVSAEDSQGSNFGANPFADLYSRTHGGADYSVEPAQRYISGFNAKKTSGKMLLKTTSPATGISVTEELNVLTGKSILAPIITTWQTLNTMENALLTARLTKATQFKLVQVDISDSTNEQADKIMASVKNAFKNSETIDKTKGSYQNRLAPVPVDDLVFVPKKGEKGAITVNAVGGELSETPMKDIEYMRNKLFAGLSVLKAYIGWEETTPGGLGDSTLTKLDERFGRRVSRLQLILKDILIQVIEHYWTRSKIDRTLENIPEYNILLGKVSTKEDQDLRAALEDNFRTASSIIDLARDELFADKINKDKLFTYIFEEILNLDISKFDNSVNPEEISLKINELFLEGTYSELLNKDNLRYLFNTYDIALVDEDEVITLTSIAEALYNTSDRTRLLSEATYRDLRSDSKNKDPKRLSKSKRLTVKYTGLEDDGKINFVVTAEDPAKNSREGKPTSYKTKVLLKDAQDIFTDHDVHTTGVSLVRQAIDGDLSVSCECPASMYWGQQYKGTQQDYSLVKNTIAPTRNLPTQVVCKHVLATLTALPFWNNTLVRDFRAKGLLGVYKKKRVQKLPKVSNVDKQQVDTQTKPEDQVNNDTQEKV